MVHLDYNVSSLTLFCQKSNVRYTIISLKKFAGGGGGLFDYSVTPGPGLSKVKLKMSGTNSVMPGQVKARAKELDNNELHLHLLWKLFHCNFIVLLSSGPGSPFFKG